MGPSEFLRQFAYDDDPLIVQDCLQLASFLFSCYQLTLAPTFRPPYGSFPLKPVRRARG